MTVVEEEVLILVKAYPVISKKYIELVCTAGIRRDGLWVRIHPIQYRFLGDSKKYKKFQWVKIKLVKNSSDGRPESYSPLSPDDIELGEYVDTKGEWQRRKDLIINERPVHTNIAKIIEGARNYSCSLVTFKPTVIKRLVCEKKQPDEIITPARYNEELIKQGSLFKQDQQVPKTSLRIVPFNFKYEFVDDAGTKSTLTILDWEIGQLYWNCFDKDGDENKAVEKVREKYEKEFVLSKKKDIYFFLGTHHRWHKYMIVGVFYPPAIPPLPLFEQDQQQSPR